MHMSAEEFELLVAEALDEIPAELAALIDNCVILVEDYPPPDLPHVLGLYSGIPLTERGQYYTGLPDRILIQSWRSVTAPRRLSRRSGSPSYTRSRITSVSTTTDSTSSATTNSFSADKSS